MLKTTKLAIIEAAKEYLRMIVLSIIPVLMASVNLETGEIAIAWKVIWAVIFVTTLRAIDKYIHEDKSIDSKGLVPF